MYSGYEEWVHTSFSSSARWSPSSWVAVGRDGIEDPLVDMVYRYIFYKYEISSPPMMSSVKDMEINMSETYKGNGVNHHIICRNVDDDAKLQPEKP